MEKENSNSKSKNDKAKESLMRHGYWRWITLLLACLLIFGDSYSFDNPEALESHIEEDVKIDLAEFNLLNSELKY